MRPCDSVALGWCVTCVCVLTLPCLQASLTSWRWRAVASCMLGETTCKRHHSPRRLYQAGHVLSYGMGSSTRCFLWYSYHWLRIKGATFAHLVPACIAGPPPPPPRYGQAGTTPSLNRTIGLVALPPSDGMLPHQAIAEVRAVP